MSKEYTTPEVVEIGKAQEVILGEKPTDGIDDGLPREVGDTDLDD